MRTIGLFFLIATFIPGVANAQLGDTSFSREWLDIDTTLTIQQLPKTALEKVNRLYPATIKANLGAQQLKCMIYQLTLETAIQESIDIPAINRVKKELRSQKDSLTRMLLQAMLAKQYKQYFNQYQWKISGRTPNTASLQQPVTQWSMADFHKAIRQAYREALSKPSLLQKTPALALAAICIPGSNAPKPDNWWELLLMEQLTYEKNPIGEMPTSEGLYKWLNLAIADPVTFQQCKLPTNDSSSEIAVLKIYQQLIASKEKKNQYGNWIQLHLDRINWAWEKSNHAATLRGAYLQSLQKTYATYPEQPASLHAAYLLAQLYLQDGDGKNTLKEKGTVSNPQLEAEKILSDALKRFVVPIAETQPLQNLLTNIRSQQIQSSMEMVYIPNQPILSLIRYRNTRQAYIRVVALPNNEWEKYTSFQQEKKQDLSILNKVFIQEKTWKLPAAVDRREHTTEIKIDPLPAGKYLLIAATQNDLFNNECAISITPFQVSAISLLQLNNDWYVLNRESGLPIPGAFFQFYNQNYSGNQIRYEPISGASGLSKQDGSFSFQKPRAYYEGIRVKFQQDEIWLQSGVYANMFSVEQNEQYDAKKATPAMLLYTDRKIYRPAQTIYWKGIGVTNEDNSKTQLLPEGTTATILLMDSNNQAIDSATIQLNSFGSCSGQFVLPSKTLTGRFTIVARGFTMNGEHSILMEAYKRPGFSIEWKKINKTYGLYDSIPIMGSAIAYAGNKLQDVPVQYSIQKQPRWMPYWNKLSGAYPTTRRNKEIIKSGNTKTDEKGDFYITIPASIDSLEGDASNVYYQYVVTVDITNGNGESQSKQLNIPVSSQSVFIHWELAEKMLPAEWKKSKLFVENISSQKVNAPVSLSIYKLSTPKNNFRKRYWPIPDEQIMSEEEFRAAFPLDAYRDETNAKNWKISETIRTDTFIATLNGEFNSRNQLFSAGTYRIETFVTDTISGKQIKDVRIFEIVDPAFLGGKMPHELTTLSFQNTPEKNTGDTLQAVSFIKNGPKYVIEKWQTPDTAVISSKQLESDNRITLIQRVSKSSGMHYFSRIGIFQNRIWEESYQWQVQPKLNTLTISATSFRDKTLPGSLEKWTISIRDTGNSLPTAELLSAMYDVSLDQIIPFQWTTPQNVEAYLYPVKSNFAHNFKAINSFIYFSPETKNTQYPPTIYTQLAGDAYAIINQNRERIVNGKLLVLPYQYSLMIDGAPLSEMVVASDAVMKDPSVAYSSKPGTNLLQPSSSPSVEKNSQGSEEDKSAFSNVNLRRNVSETAFFFPHVLADSSGKYTISFTMPESLTRWKWQNLAHTRSGIFGTFTTEIITQKSLMVLPGLPRFLREGDGMEITTQLANLGESELTGVVVMELVDPSTEKPVDGWFQNVFPQQYFTVAAGKTETIRFPLQIPFGFNKPLKIRIKAKAGNYEDGEENILPVITNRVLITKSKSFWIAKDTSVTLQLPSLLKSNSPSITHESFQFEMATQPAWYIVKSLPHLIQNTHPCTEQIWNRLLANQLAAYTISQFPVIATTLDQWKKDTTALQSTFTKNQSLQTMLMEETPWVQQAQSEEEQLKALSILLDSLQLKNENTGLLKELNAAQLSSGGFRWMEGDREDLTTTLYILNGMAQLTQLKAWQSDVKPHIDQVTGKALQFTDSAFAQYYRDILPTINAKADELVPQQWIAYAWMRNQFPNISYSTAEALAKIQLQLTKNWQRYDLLAQTWIAQIALYSGSRDIAVNKIIPSLFEKAVRDSSMGLYWKFFPKTNGYYSKMTMQSRMFTLFKQLEIKEQQKYQSYLYEMIQWVLQQKKSNHWINTPSTADACFALLTILPKVYMENPGKITVQTGELTYQTTSEKSEAGTGYFRQRIDGKKVSPGLGKIKISRASEKKSDTTNSISSPVTGSFYWQYFEDIQKVKDFQHPSLGLQKTLFKKKIIGNSVSLEPITALTNVKRGDQVIIRLTITCKQPMDYVYLKDMRGAGMEPDDIVSRYKSQDGLQYYQTTQDAHTGFFIRHLEKGVYIIDYPLNITHLGSFAGGIAQIECLYAPEYRAHAANTPFRVAE